MKKIGWIGTGVMGNAMLQHIIKAGYTVHVYNRTKSKTDNLVSMGAIYESSIEQISQKVDILFTIIGDPQSVRDTYFGEQGILKNISPDTILVDMTTTKPTLSKEIYTAHSKSLDAPVSGGDTGAINGTLSIMVGGDMEVYDELFPIFELLGRSITYIGRAGTGQDTKMANQIAIAGNTIGMTESLLYAERAGLDLEVTMKVLCAGGACSWGYLNLAPRILKGDFETYFFIKHFVKDMAIALDECRKMEIQLPGLELVFELYNRMMEHGEGNLGMQSLILELKRMNNIEK